MSPAKSRFPTYELNEMMKYRLVTYCLLAACLAPQVAAQQVLVEAESFDDLGGWKLDTQFIDTMGSPYVLAHGLGRPVKDATTVVNFPETGEYHVYVRTKDWVARWEAPGQPGRFQLVVDGTVVDETFVGPKNIDPETEAKHLHPSNLSLAGAE